MRTFIRHPSDIPIEVQHESKIAGEEKFLSDVSVGGLSFKSKSFIEEKSVVKVKIPLIKPIFESTARVVWCKKEGEYYDVGVEFIETKDAFKFRMVEQICQIEHYKKEIYEKEGRSLSGREAALEWINKFAGQFQEEK